MPGVVAAGHPESAEAGAAALRAGGNAVDAAVAAVLASFAVESPLTGLGAGGYMVVHDGGETTAARLLRRRAGARRHAADRGAGAGRGRLRRRPPRRRSTSARSPARCRGRPPGWSRRCGASARCRWPSSPAPAIRLAREGAPVNHQQAYILEILEPIHARLPGTRELYAPEGRTLREGETFRFEELAVALERFAAEGAVPFYRGEVAAALRDFVVDGGGTLGRGDLAAYAAIERAPVRAEFRGTEVLTNPPPSAGGTLIAYSLDLLERLGPRSGPEQLVAAMDAANEHRASLLGSTTHISVIDAAGICAAVTCSNGSGSGVLVPGTGVILNNMLGEEDLNPRGFHQIPPGTRVPSMMAPTVVLRDGEVVLAVGSAGSNRIRSAILQTVVRVLEQGMGPAGGDRRAATALGGRRRPGRAGDRRRGAGAARGGAASTVVRRPETNLFFGGVQAVARDPAHRRAQRRRRPAPRRRRRLRLSGVRHWFGIPNFDERSVRMEAWRAGLTSITRPRGCSTTSRGRRGEARLELLDAAERRRGVAGGAARRGRRRPPHPAAGRAGDRRRRAALLGPRSRRARPASTSSCCSRFRAALGVPYGDPDEKIGTEADLEAARRTQRVLDAGFPPEELLRNARTIGMAMARVAEANRELVVRNLTGPGDNERDLANRLAADRRVHAAAGHRLPRLRLPGQPAGAGQTRRDRRRRPRGGGDRRGGRALDLLRRPGRVHQPRRGDRAGGAGRGRRPLRGTGDRASSPPRCGW